MPRIAPPPLGNEIEGVEVLFCPSAFAFGACDATEWNTVVSAMNITNSPQPIVFNLMPTRGVPGGASQVIRTAPAFGVAVLDLRTVPDIPPRWMGAVTVGSSGGIPPVAQIPARREVGTA